MRFRLIGRKPCVAPVPVRCRSCEFCEFVNNFPESFLLMTEIYETNEMRQGKPICSMKQKTISIWERGGRVDTGGTDHPLPGELRFMPAGISERFGAH
jgi:hypothetical protein